MKRNDAITTLEVLKANCSKHSRDYQALDYAISSLKTDEKYQLMYEGEEVYDKDTVAWMFRELQLEIEEIEVAKENTEIRAGECCMKGACIDLIQAKINSLKEDKDEQN